MYAFILIAFDVEERTPKWIQIGVVIVWDNVDCMNRSWDTYMESPADFAAADDIITNLVHVKEREPDDTESTP